MADVKSKLPSADEAPVLDEVEIPEPGTSDARSARWLGFEADCECHVLENRGEQKIRCAKHLVDNRIRTRSCSHVISRECRLHRGWTPGDKAAIARRPHAFTGDPDMPDSEAAA